MQEALKIKGIEDRYRALTSSMDERMRRRWAGAEAKAYGCGGRRAVSVATGMSVNTVRKGQEELARQKKNPNRTLPSRIRKSGGGRKKCTTLDKELKPSLLKLVEPTTRGDPGSALCWTCKSTDQLTKELIKQGRRVSKRTVAKLLKESGYSLQGTRKTKEGGKHPDRNAQFEKINETVITFQGCGQPVISVDTKKKELVGEFKNAGQEWQLKGNPEEVQVYDFIDKNLGKAIPYGIFDITDNKGWVSVGIDHDTAKFAGEAIRRWWDGMGSKRYPAAQKLLIICDGGGSNSSRSRLWKVSLQELSDTINIPIQVCHLPPGTSKWNKIEHRMFCHITRNWRGRPLISHEVIVNLISNTTTNKGLTIKAELDTNTYPTGIKVTDDELGLINLHLDNFRGEWNYSILPRNKKKYNRSVSLAF